MLMSFRLSGVLFGLVFLVAGCGEEGVGESCKKACDAFAPLKCSKENPATCVADCETAAHSFPSCKSQGESLVRCSGDRSTSDWECDADGEAQLKDNVCTAEQQAFLMCALGS